MVRHLEGLIGLHPKCGREKRLLDVKLHSSKIKPLTMMDAVQEVAIYIHRFHNLDLFQQGWYRIKISMKWEDDNCTSMGTPARVVQYDAPDLASDDIYGVWRIDDADNSFSTQPFRIKYARQDICLCIMISFSLPLCIYQAPSPFAAILKFELMHAPVTDKGLGLLASRSASSVSVHEFRIPPKALLGLHSYCPINFDPFHQVHVDASVHTTILNSDSYMKVPRELNGIEGVSSGIMHMANYAYGELASIDMEQIMIVKALLVARDLLLERLQRLGKAVNRVINLSGFTYQVFDVRFSDSVLTNQDVFADVFSSAPNNPKIDLEIEAVHATGNLENIFHSLGSQILYLWNAFLQFHRENKTLIIDYLRNEWAKDRRAEWSIWMVYSKVEMPHHYISSGIDDSFHHAGHKKASGPWKLAADPAHVSVTRAELHRRSIAQMRINNQSIQDMYIFGDPLRVPIVFVERVINATRRTFSENSYFRNVDSIDSPNLSDGSRAVHGNKLAGSTATYQSARELKIIIFVHGFQGHHLDLRLVRNQWLLVDPKIEFLMSEVNEEKTSGDFREMGTRLAQEVVCFMKKKMDKASKYGCVKCIKVSFVGHSIGNVIIRAAISESIMEPYLRYFYTYVSISGPHLGYLYCSNLLFNSGMWILKKLKGPQCIHQLTLTDHPDLSSTFFYKLCQEKTLENFRHIVLLSSPQDGYVPYHSARIELCQAASSDCSKKGKALLEMLNNCMDQIRSPTHQQRVFMRCDVNFDTSSYGRSLNTFIGRAAHIEFLETDTFAKFIMWSFPELFS